MSSVTINFTSLAWPRLLALTAIGRNFYMKLHRKGDCETTARVDAHRVRGSFSALSVVLEDTAVLLRSPSPLRWLFAGVSACRINRR